MTPELASVGMEIPSMYASPYVCNGVQSSQYIVSNQRSLDQSAMEDNQSPHVAMVPSPGMGHLIPFVEFAKHLVLHHNCSVTFITLSVGAPSNQEQAYIDSLPANIASVQLPPVRLDDLPANARVETRIFTTLVRSLPSLREEVKKLSRNTRLAALVVDLFGSDVFDVAREVGIDAYMLFASTAMTLSLMLHLPVLDRTVVGEYRDMPEPLKLPGCVPVQGRDLVEPLQERAGEAYSGLLRHARRYPEAKGILLNTFSVLEPNALKALETRAAPPVYPIGPLTQSGSRLVEGSECLKWLDEQPAGSVLFVSFGSGGTLSTAQLTELALGLELSQQRFMWVVRSPNDISTNAAFFNTQTTTDPFAFLPAGFVERTKDVGLLVPSWAPQIEVLSHASTGGFLSHCGWNSTLESVVNGVPLIAWPLYAEQKMNALMLVADIRVAIRPEMNEKRGVVERHEVARVVKALMEGEEGKKIRNRARELKAAAGKALAPGGSSYEALSEVTSSWKTHHP